MKNKSINKHVVQIITIVLLVATVICYFLVPGVSSFFNRIVKLFSSTNIESIVEYIRSFGIYAVIVSFLLMVFQSLVAPLPAFLITFANAAIFGWWQGAILSWSSSMVGAALCFYIAKILGRDVAEKLTSKLALKSVDSFFEKYGKHTILICRLLPFVSFDIISYAAGLTSMGFMSFFIATGIGQLPATIVYSYVGGMLTGGVRMIVTALLVLFALSILIILIKRIYNERKLNRKR